MTLKQANQVNKYYLDKEQEVALLKDSIFMQSLLSDAQIRYSTYLESEFNKKSIETNSELIKYYEKRETEFKYEISKKTRTNIYLFIAMTFIFLAKF